MRGEKGTERYLRRSFILWREPGSSGVWGDYPPKPKRGTGGIVIDEILKEALNTTQVEQIRLKLERSRVKK